MRHGGERKFIVSWSSDLNRTRCRYPAQLASYASLDVAIRRELPHTICRRATALLSQMQSTDIFA